MPHHLARLLEPLLRVLLPGNGRRRRSGVVRGGAHRRCPGSSGQRPRPVHRAGHEPLAGEDNVLVRPYLVAHEQRAAARRSPARRRALVVAVRGIDVGPRGVHGVEVTA
ncbi:hypothetical protein [Streptomyces sp. DH24]|uniref:hypothetical protein n=1 Tax=Streptomyces sp. DH24 TaxID=3040123 RepID=UPI002442E745|nr:hypothetical protein [Streptomyces sp. DH24]MDG9716729.1 hypothetical protein [Streptomyces sp. DH24]